MPALKLWVCLVQLGPREGHKPLFNMDADNHPPLPEAFGRSGVSSSAASGALLPGSTHTKPASLATQVLPGSPWRLWGPQAGSPKPPCPALTCPCDFPSHKDGITPGLGKSLRAPGVHGHGSRSVCLCEVTLAGRVLLARRTWGPHSPCWSPSHQPSSLSFTRQASPGPSQAAAHSRPGLG